MAEGKAAHERIVNWIPERSQVLDLGCGSGELLELLAKEKQVQGLGVERDEKRVRDCLSKGLTVFQDTIENTLSDYPDQQFDVVIINQAMQMLGHPPTVLKEALRVGRRAIVGFPNFGHWEIRTKLLITGRMPGSKTLPYEWYDTPNIHLFTIKDFIELARQVGSRVQRFEYLLHGNHWNSAEPWPGAANWLATDALYELKANRT